jgi:hypothetical protein
MTGAGCPASTVTVRGNAEYIALTLSHLWNVALNASIFMAPVLVYSQL